MLKVAAAKAEKFESNGDSGRITNEAKDAVAKCLADEEAAIAAGNEAVRQIVVLMIESGRKLTKDSPLWAFVGEET